MSEEETQAIADARETVDLVLAAALGLAERVVAHAAEHGLAYATMEDALAVGDHLEWKISASYGAGHTFVSVRGEPQVKDRAFVHMAELGVVMGNATAAFLCNVPREWIMAAVVTAEVGES